MFDEFKAFIAKGNVLDLAVGVIIGAAFGKIVSSLTDDLIMPVVGKVFGGLDFSSKYVVLSGTVAPDSGRVVYAGHNITRLPLAHGCMAMRRTEHQRLA